jgi:NADPH2 dehydrogenase
VKPVAQLKTASAFREYLESAEAAIPFDDALQPSPDSPLAQPYRLSDRTIGNRFAMLPMEGWDGDADGKPTELTMRRWRRFGESGAKLIFGGEAVAPSLDGRSNPRGLVLTAATEGAIAGLRDELVGAHEERFGTAADLMVGIQLSHAGRFCRPFADGKRRPRIAYRHPLLDAKMGIEDDAAVVSDLELADIVGDYVREAVRAGHAGFDFVDLKACHGYLGHELLSAVDRPGPYGGSLENRTRFFRQVIEGIHSDAPGLEIGVRLSAFDFIPFRPGRDGVGEPVPFEGRYPYAFGGDGTGTGIDLAEPLGFLSMLAALGVRLVCVTAGCGYYDYHIMRPCMTPEPGVYLPPEEPLAGVARMMHVTAELRRRLPGLTYVASAYSYLQQWLPHVAQRAVRTGGTDFVGLGRMSISYPEMVADVLAGRPLRSGTICRACTRCLAAARGGIVSGCYLLDDFYRNRPERDEVERLIRGR